MVFYFFSIDNKFYNALYSGFNAPLQDRHLIELPSKIKRSRVSNFLIGWKAPGPWVRAKLFYNVFLPPKALINGTSGITKNDANICFIVYGRVLQFYGPCIIYYLKRRYRNAHIVVYLGDVSSSFTFSIPVLKKKVELVFSFDRMDAERNQVLFLQEPYSTINNEKTEIEYDFMFVGNEKGRHEKLIHIFQTLKSNGYKCIFYINGVDENKQLLSDSIIYNRFLDYDDVVLLIKKSRCIIEVLQMDADSTTTRFSEALLYKKYLLTDSEYLRNAKDVAPNIICFDNSNNDKLKRIFQPLEYDNKIYKDDLSVDSMVKSIENSLSV